jgi:putative transposase
MNPIAGGASMPRAARIKEPTAIYHTMSRSITEFDLFPNNSDKECFLDLLKKYSEKFHCKVYGYCLMTNHYHLIVDTCGYDISKLMKSLNQTYVKFINKQYNRRGHLLAERFNSKIIDSTEYLLTVSAYLHNNPKDLPEYSGREFEYPYSSMRFYISRHKDKRKLVDTDFILSCVNGTDKNLAIKAYLQMVTEKRDTGINKKLRQYLEEFINEQYEKKSYREVILRDRKPEEIIKKIAEIYGIEDILELKHRWKRSSMQFRQVAAYTLNIFCGMNISEVCKQMHNITASCCAKLGDKGFELVRRDTKLKTMLLGI